MHSYKLAMICLNLFLGFVIVRRKNNAQIQLGVLRILIVEEQENVSLIGICMNYLQTWQKGYTPLSLKCCQS